MSEGHPQRAIDDAFQPVIEYFENAYKDRQGRVYSARNVTQSLMYAALPKEEGEDILVLDPTWAGAYWLTAYALVELGEFEERRSRDSVLLCARQSTARVG
jgi:hypothetical protein